MIDPWFLENLACPRDQLSLTAQGDVLSCGKGHRYPVVKGVPVMLLEDAEQTHPSAARSLAQGADPGRLPAGESAGPQPAVRTFAQKEVAATNGIMFKEVK